MLRPALQEKIRCLTERIMYPYIWPWDDFQILPLSLMKSATFLPYQLFGLSSSTLVR